MSMEDNKTMLKSVEEAITHIMNTGQSYKIGSRSLTRADLGELRKMRKDLQAEITNQTDQSLFAGFYAAEFDGR